MTPTNSSDSTTARLLGSATSGILELLGFHPVDTLAKRLMNNKTKISGPGMTMADSIATLNKVIFKDASNLSTLRKYFSLFPGLGAAAGYKVLQRMYKFGGQPFVKDYLKSNHHNTFKNAFGESHAGTIMNATAGSIIGIGEVALLPLDALKIKMQTASADNKLTAWKIIKEEGWSLYRGIGWTIARNAPGSFALFGGSAATKQYIFQIDDKVKLTWTQETVCSAFGAVASIALTAPLDVIKTRIQAKSSANAESGFKIVRDMVVNEGLSSFFKGLTPKILVVGPKLIFSFTVAKQLIPFFGNLIDKK